MVPFSRTSQSRLGGQGAAADGGRGKEGGVGGGRSRVNQTTKLGEREGEGERRVQGEG